MKWQKPRVQLKVLDKQNFECKIVNIFLAISFNICLGCLKELSDWDGSFEYPQHMFWMRNKKVKFLVHTRILRPDMYLSSADNLCKQFGPKSGTTKQNVRPDLHPNCMTLWWCTWKDIQKIFWKKKIRGKQINEWLTFPQRLQNTYC